MSVAFVSTNGRNGSHVMRSANISAGLRARGYNVESIVITSKWEIGTVLKPLRFETIVFLKWFSLAYARMFKLAGKRVVFDCIDDFQFQSGQPAYHAGRRYIDMFITNNNAHRVYLVGQLGIPEEKVRVIEHHHTNFEGITKPWQGVSTAGYVGAHEYFQISDQTRKSIQEMGVSIYLGDPTIMTNESALRENLKLDCALIYFDANHPHNQLLADTWQFVLNFKPAQKILTPFSLGIPVIFLPCQSYLFAVQQAGYQPEDFLVATNEAELLARLKWLMNPANETEITRLLARQKKVASLFTLDKMLDKYEEAFFKSPENTRKQRFLSPIVE